MAELQQNIRPLITSGEFYKQDVQTFIERRRAFPTAPTRRDWVRHSAFFLLTLLTATIAGIHLAASDLQDASASATAKFPEATMWFDYVRFIPALVVQLIGEFISDAQRHPQLITQGLTFALALLVILLAHEAGHYIACRRYRVNATLPYFIPAPPFFLAGTFGAFIKIKSPIPSRRALFDIGIAGPLAGFILIIPIAILAAVTAHPAPSVVVAATTVNDAYTTVIFHDPLLFRLIWRLFHVSMDTVAFNPFYYAAWIGLLVTSLNLMPVGQLDGGHAIYATLGARAHRWLGRTAFLTVATFAVCGFLLHNSPSGFVYTILLLVMLFVKHPYTEDENIELNKPRIFIALLTLLVFVLSFLPFPITIV
ncbi:MAG: hypothetical protein NVSMB56_08130 [Pyrinomonadaceae bacterium]